MKPLGRKVWRYDFVNEDVMYDEMMSQNIEGLEIK
jgi:hypothetical protein